MLLPVPSPSESSWPELGKAGQLSAAQCISGQGKAESGNPSESESSPQNWPFPAKPVLQIHSPDTYEASWAQLAIRGLKLLLLD